MSCKPPKKLVNPVYEEFSVIARSMHDEDAEECAQHKKLISYDVPAKAKSKLSGKEIQVLWFGVPKPASEHDWYGSIRFKIKLQDLMHYFDGSLPCYYIDRVVFPYSSSSRLFITNNLHNIPYSAIKMNFGESGYPIWRDRDGVFYQAKKCDGKKHNVEIVIDATEDISSWLYHNCERVPVNHYDANTTTKSGSYRQGICNKYNKFGYSCPNDTDLEETRHRFNEICPGFFTTDNGDSDDYSTDSDDYSTDSDEYSAGYDDHATDSSDYHDDYNLY